MTIDPPIIVIIVKRKQKTKILTKNFLSKEKLNSLDEGCDLSIEKIGNKLTEIRLANLKNSLRF